VDENLFYKGVDKSKVHGARLHQHHSAPEGSEYNVSPGADKNSGPLEPPYPFDTGNTLLALTKKHNASLPYPIVALLILFQMTIAQIVHDNEVGFLFKYIG